MFETIVEQANAAKASKYPLQQLSTTDKNKTLEAMASTLLENQAFLLEANQKDIEQAKQNQMTAALLDRLTLTPERIQGMANGLRTVAELPDPLTRVLDEKSLHNGLFMQKVPVPIGVIAIIYESRPNVTADAIGLCFKSGNVVILKGGKEAIHSNRAIVQILKAVLPAQNYVQFIDETSREATQFLLRQDSCIDLVIPRGGIGLIKAISDNSSIPVLKHLNGICHVYVDIDANQSMAEQIVLNAKCQRPGVCNAMETLLVHQDIAHEFLPNIVSQLQQQTVEVFGCEVSQSILKQAILPATETSWETEYLDLKLSLRVVKDLEQAIDHINTYGSGHSDAIVTNSDVAAKQFLATVDSSAVYHNASTRFTDGAEFDMGAEMGISTNKLHARGPVGLEELTIYKYILRGDGTIRD